MDPMPILVKNKGVCICPMPILGKNKGVYICPMPIETFL